MHRKLQGWMNLNEISLSKRSITLVERQHEDYVKTCNVNRLWNKSVTRRT